MRVCKVWGSLPVQLTHIVQHQTDWIGTELQTHEEEEGRRFLTQGL